MTTLTPKAALVATMVAIGSLSALTACQATATRESSAEYMDDATITTKVKTALAQDPQVKAYQVSVETYRGVVQLSGFVDNEASMRRASQLAQGVAGVRSVKNDIHLKPAG
jgi:hyperosmotically inducible periplasmic protein